MNEVFLFPYIIVLTGPVRVGGETGGDQAAVRADPEMLDLGHVQLHTTLHGTEQLSVEDGLAILQKTWVNTGYSGHTLTLTARNDE